ncbi:hypothetical protein SLEP1_g38483 [Rubroshorea leprosula]|nr:hypothetical protein SLEP1_g38483 [Rubroshorea leprosula]
MVGVTSILGGSSDNTGSGIARRLVLKTGLNIIIACNIPKNSPMLEGYDAPPSPTYRLSVFT